jgi:uncharacterized protein (DUF1778 family)
MSRSRPWGIVSIRISTEDRASIESALELAGEEDRQTVRRYWRSIPSLSDFIRDAALARARRLLEQRKTRELELERKTKPTTAAGASSRRKTPSRT